jgi:hypothetical protein
VLASRPWLFLCELRLRFRLEIRAVLFFFTRRNFTSGTCSFPANSSAVGYFVLATCMAVRRCVLSTGCVLSEANEWHPLIPWALGLRLHFLPDIVYCVGKFFLCCQCCVRFMHCTMAFMACAMVLDRGHFACNCQKRFLPWSLKNLSLISSLYCCCGWTSLYGATGKLGSSNLSNLTSLRGHAWLPVAGCS